MKGLLIKDWGLTKNQAGFFVMILVISVACSATMKNPFFAMGYATSFLSIFAVGTVAYDEYDNGMSFLFTMPISRKLYVKEKYVFAFLTALISLCVSTVLSLVVAVVIDVKYTVDDWVMILTMSLIVVFIVLSVVLPVRMKYNSENHRMAMLIVFGALAAVVGGIYAILSALGIDIEPFVEDVLFASPWMALAIVLIVGIILISISYRISVRVLAKREF